MEKASSLSCVVVGAQKMQRNVGLLADNPAIVRLRRNLKQDCGFQLNDPSIIECRSRRAQNTSPDMLDMTASRAHARSDV